jgi:hypothetical protein
VGANKEPQLLHVNTGAAYVYQRDPVRGLWHKQAKLVPQGARVGGGLLYIFFIYGFGNEVAIDQDAIVISACPPAGTLNSSPEQAAYLFRRNSSTGRWRQQAKLMPPAQSQQGNFGCAVAISGNTVLAGATSEAAEDGTRPRGAVYLFDLRDATP